MRSGMERTQAVLLFRRIKSRDSDPSIIVPAFFYYYASVYLFDLVDISLNHKFDTGVDRREIGMIEHRARKSCRRAAEIVNCVVVKIEIVKNQIEHLCAGVVARDEIFLETKLWPAFYENEDAVEKTLDRLGTDYIDLLLIHQPAGNYLAGYRLMEKAYREGKVKAIGLSNFNEAHIRDNFELFDFALTGEEMAEIAGLNRNKRYYTSTPELLAKYAQMVPQVDEQK